MFCIGGSSGMVPVGSLVPEADPILDAPGVLFAFPCPLSSSSLAPWPSPPCLFLFFVRDVLHDHLLEALVHDGHVLHHLDDLVLACGG